jgi:hypothetical protein
MPRRALAWNYNVSSATTPVGFQPFSLPPEDNSEPNKTS